MNDIKAGAILVEGFSHPRFFQVIGMTASGKSAIVRQLRATDWDSSEQSGITRPCLGVYVGPPHTCRLTKHDSVKVPGYQAYAYVWDGKNREYWTD